ncbi:MAG: hypothetical protein ACFCUR_04430 [Rhodomicrobiaceae bacterium]
MMRSIIFMIAELSAIFFAVYMGFMLFGSPEYSPPPETAIQQTFIFCSVCIFYWWIQSGSLAMSGVGSSIAMATDILVSLVPILVIGYAIVDFWRGSLPLSDYKQYAAYFALAVVLLDVTFNAIIMARLSRRYLGEVTG